MSSSRPLIGKTYTPEENHVRSILYARQMEKIRTTDAVHSLIREGYEYANLPSTHCPDALAFSKHLFEHNGRQLTNAKNAYLDDFDRHEALYDKFFPATNYIRPLKDLDFTPLPDIAHDYFGHMPIMFHPKLVQIQRDVARIYMQGNSAQRKAMYNLPRYILEYGVVKEKGVPKILGAGLLSSALDFDAFIQNKFELVPADLKTIMHTPRSPHKPHTRLFVYESMEAVYDLVQQFEELLSLEYSK